MSPEERAEYLTRYRNGYAEVIEALRGATDADLEARPDPTSWSAREVAYHLADSETTSYIRLRRLLAEDRPEIQGYDENEFARHLHYDRPIEASLEVLRAVRAASAELLERLDESDWQRAGTHSESGSYSVEGWLEIYAAHAHDHANQIRRARGIVTADPRDG